MEQNSILNKLPSKLILENGINLVLDEKIHYGKENLSDISWYQYKIVNNKELGIVYDNICLSLFRITELVRIEASKEIIKKRVSKKETVRPHIDYMTGNIHPSKEYIANQNKLGKIQQLVLCNGLGPHIPEKQLDDDYYVYKNCARQSGSKVHKACYYPLIDNNLNLQDNWRYQLLEEIWNLINPPTYM
ncbi:hypothetical protein SAMN02746066_04329 [Anaerosporobacter mobilis DSM 15930]|jgi:hypothetical protein|uniref:Uncharacterized protein n=1 Tax=Anaerosporobacter mobilis DSM 15930 TaxID=1120996 RepID=A0A1M7NBG7_9FIRM|nr:hypothetical protein [Anaerosporobacter mobilis]SHN00448.1 hypothetical protein SAMN02746066_04329 [Anaerosporobacter mobilis DSM 15930]